MEVSRKQKTAAEASTKMIDILSLYFVFDFSSVRYFFKRFFVCKMISIFLSFCLLFLPLHSVHLRPSCHDSEFSFYRKGTTPSTQAFNQTNTTIRWFCCDHHCIFQLYASTQHCCCYYYYYMDKIQSMRAICIRPAHNIYDAVIIYASNSGNIVEVSGTDVAAAVKDYD